MKSVWYIRRVLVKPKLQTFPRKLNLSCGNFQGLMESDHYFQFEEGGDNCNIMYIHPWKVIELKVNRNKLFHKVAEQIYTVSILFIFTWLNIAFGDTEHNSSKKEIHRKQWS